MSNRFVVEMSEVQFRLMNVAIEEWFRVRLNQWSDLARDLARGSYKHDSNDPQKKEKFAAYMARMHATEAVLKAAMEVAQPYRYTMPAPKSVEQIVLEDMWQAIRFFTWEYDNKDTPLSERGFGPCEPFYESKEPPMKIECVKE